MPSIINCRNCIIANDVRAHSVTKNNLSVKWQRETEADNNIARVVNSFHRQDGSYSLSRAEIFETNDPYEKVVKAIWWGYPNGMMFHFHEVAIHFSDLAQTIAPHSGRHLNMQEFESLYDSLSAIMYVGASTISKLLYFFGIYQDNTQCVIVDRFVRESMAHYDEFHPVHQHQPFLWYLEHARQINEVGIDGASPEQVEYFLFSH